MPGDHTAAVVVIVAAVVILLITLIGFIASRWRKAGPNEALIISGRGRFKIVTGSGRFVWPVFEQVEVLSLEVMTLDITTPEVYTNPGVPIIVDGVAQVKVGSSEEMIRTAAEQFLGKSVQERMNVALQTVEGHVRAILGTMTVEELIRNRDAFAQRVQDVAETDLNNMGLHVVSFTIRDIRDQHGYLEALSKPQTAVVKRDAVIAEAEAQRDATIRSAAADQAGQEARFSADTKIRQAERDYQIQAAEYRQAMETKKAEADLAYELQKYKTGQVVKQEQVRVEIVEKEMQTQVQQAEIERRQRELEATVHRPADAERYRIQTLAQAERERLETEAIGRGQAAKSIGEGEAAAERARGLAVADVEKAKGLAHAEVTKAEGLAEGEAIRAKGFAEAEAMMKKAEAWQRYNQAAIIERIVSVLPEIAAAIASPLAKTQSITLVNTGGGGGTGAAQITQDIAQIVAQLPPVLQALTGVDIKELLQKVPGLAEQPKAE